MDNVSCASPVRMAGSSFLPRPLPHTWRVSPPPPRGRRCQRFPSPPFWPLRSQSSRQTSLQGRAHPGVGSEGRGQGCHQRNLPLKRAHSTVGEGGPSDSDRPSRKAVGLPSPVHRIAPLPNSFVFLNRTPTLGRQFPSGPSCAVCTGASC